MQGVSERMASEMLAFQIRWLVVAEKAPKYTIGQDEFEESVFTPGELMLVPQTAFF